MARQVARFETKKTLSPENVATLLKEVEARRRRLSGKREAPPISLKPAVAPALPQSSHPEPEEILTAIPAEPESPPFPLQPVLSEAASTPASIPKAEAPTPKAPRRTLRELLAAFMEERNIFWGELAGGLMIVGGSVALVISLWSSGTLEKVPFWPFLVFGFVNACLFGAGWYTLRYWKLESTSRGLLAIATLLVPLSFLVLARLHSEGGGVWEISVEIASLACFVVLVEMAARILVPHQRWWLTGAVLVASASQLLFSWLIHPETGLMWVLAVGAVPVACQILCNSVALLKTVRTSALQKHEAISLFSFLGISSFALAVAFGYLVFASRDISEAPQYLSLLMAVGALPALTFGIVVHRGLAEDLEAGTLRTTATTIALAGIFFMLAAGFQAWPNPSLLILVCAVDFIAFTVVAFRYELPIVHVAAISCLAVGYLALFQSAMQVLLVGQMPEEGLHFDIFTSAESGQALVGLFFLLAIAAELIIRKGRSIHSVYYAFGSGVIATWSLLLVTLPMRGIEHPWPAMAVYAIFGVCGLLVNARWRRPLISGLALALLTGATLWTLRWRHLTLHLAGLEDAPLWGSILAGESWLLGSLAVALGIQARLPGVRAWASFWQPVDNPLNSVPRWQDAYREPLARSGEAVSLLAVLAALVGGLASGCWALEHVFTSGCLLAVFLLLAVVERRTSMARLAGLVLIGGVVAATGWAQTGAESAALAPQLPGIGLWVSVVGCLMAAMALWTMREAPEPQTSEVDKTSEVSVPWYSVLFAWRETAIVAVVLALAASLPSLRDYQSVLPFYTAIFLAATTFLLVLEFQLASLSWLGSGFVLASITYALLRQYPRAEWLTPSCLALLSQATIALAASMALKNLPKIWPSVVSPAEDDQEKTAVRWLFAEPLGQAALVSSALALPILLTVPAGTMFSCLGLFWLAVLWLIASFERGWPVLFTACKVVLVLAVLFGTTAWLESQPWFLDSPDGTRYFDPRSLQAYGIGLGGFCLLWMVVRIGLQSNQRVLELLDPTWFPVDRLVLAGLVVGQAGLAVLGVLPGTIHELLGANAAAQVALWPAEIMPFAYGSGAWVLLALVGIVLFAGLWEKLASGSVLGLTIAAATIPMLAAGDYHEQLATTSALRWWLALAFLEWSVLVWARQPLFRLAVKVGCQVESTQGGLNRWVASILLSLTAAPALVLTVVVAILGFVGVSPAGPEPGSFFDRIGWVASNVLPPAVISIVLAGYALRERSPVYAFSSGLIADLTMMGGYALGVVVDGRSLGSVEWVRVFQLGTVTAAIWSIGWLATRSWLFLGGPGSRRAGGPESPLAQPLLTVQVALGLIGNAVLLVGVLWRLVVFYPPIAVAAIQEAASLLGWLALASAATAWGLFERARLLPNRLGETARQGTPAYPPRPPEDQSLPLRQAGVVGLAAILLFACNIQTWWPGWGYRAVMLGWAAYPLAWMIAVWWIGSRRDALGRSPDRSESLVEVAAFWLGLSGALVVVLALKAAIWHGDQFWPVAATLAVSGMSGAMALWLQRPIYVYASGLLLNLAGTMFWIAAGNQPWEMLTYINVFCFALGSGLWTASELWLRGRTRPVDVRGGWVPFSSLAVTAGLVLMCVMIVLAHLAPAIGLPELQTGSFGWLALLATILATVLCLWDPAAEWVWAWLYSGGVAAVLLALENAHLSVRDLLWTYAITIGSYLLVTAMISRTSPKLQNLWGVIRLPLRGGGWPQRWFVPVQLFFVCQIVALSLWISLDFNGLLQRLAGPLAAGILALAGCLMAGIQWTGNSSGRERRGPFILEYCILVLGLLTVIELGWAWLDPLAHDLSWLWLHRNVMVMMALAIMTGIYGVALATRLPAEWAWAECSRRIGPILGVLAIAMLAVILGQEAWMAGPTGTPMTYEAIAVVALAMIGLGIAGLCFAVLPGRDPLGLSERGRTLYVYAAELIVVLIFVHLRLTLPWLFKLGIFRQYWPFILMGIAFLGVGLSEYFRRRQLRVLAEPLERTGIFLPLLPVLSYWILPNPSQYALLWFSVGLIYGMVSVFKQSWGFALWGALAANMGLWGLLHQNKVHFLGHPQIWLIPIALIGLAAEQINRDRLSENQGTALRYLCLMVIYVSSTADMFIAGLGQSWQGPLVLTLLSILGILGGMALRIRAFLYLGSSFLLLVVFTMIWHAGTDLGQKWVWWASVVALGGAMVGLFGLFEKRRNDILRVVDELKKWR
jgi:hypothetical protein